MSLIIAILLMALGYTLYTMLQTYRSMERELREIRLKCMGTVKSAVAAEDPAEAIKDKLLGALQKAVQATAPKPMPI